MSLANCQCATMYWMRKGRCNAPSPTPDGTNSRERSGFVYARLERERYSSVEPIRRGKHVQLQVAVQMADVGTVLALPPSALGLCSIENEPCPWCAGVRRDRGPMCYGECVQPVHVQDLHGPCPHLVLQAVLLCPASIVWCVLFRTAFALLTCLLVSVPIDPC